MSSSSSSSSTSHTKTGFSCLMLTILKRSLPIVSMPAGKIVRLSSVSRKYVQATLEHEDISRNTGQACGSHPYGHLVAEHGSQSPVLFQWQLLILWSPSVTSNQCHLQFCRVLISTSPQNNVSSQEARGPHPAHAELPAPGKRAV